jgi:carbamate kinase
MAESGLAVVALGGNALLRKGERGTAAEQRANLADTFAAVADVLRAGPVVVTHGNGPQVGNELLRQELGAAEAPPLPLYVAVAQTQAEIGALAVSELPQVTGRPAVVVLTRVAVAADDPAFDHPTKPIGPFYDEEQARGLESERGWTLTEDAGRGWRRVVPSPRPLEVLELESIRALAATGTSVVAAGGGGVPVVARNGRHDGVDAVIDKDHASASARAGSSSSRRSRRSTAASGRPTRRRCRSSSPPATPLSCRSSRPEACARRSRPPSGSSSGRAARR